jgi:hypothetical protein
MLERHGDQGESQRLDSHASTLRDSPHPAPPASDP